MSIQSWIWKRSVKQLQAKKLFARTGLYNQTIKSIGILADCTLPKDQDLAFKFRSELIQKGYQVEMMVFVKEMPEKIIPQIGYFTQKDTSWLHMPKRIGLHSFANKRYDLLINFYTSQNPKLQYLSAVNPSGLRVAAQIDDDFLADLFLMPKNANSLVDYRRALLEYLKL